MKNIRKKMGVTPGESAISSMSLASDTVCWQRMKLLQIPFFDEHKLILHNSGSAKAFGDDLLAYYVHYVNFGIKENRKYTTIDATTKAGFTVSGMNGQILASPRLIVPSSADNSSVSNIPSSLTLPSSAAPTPVPTPAPTPEPTTPEPEVPCNHEFDGRKQITGTTMHGPVCVLCGYINEEQAEAVPLIIIPLMILPIKKSVVHAAAL